MDVSSRRMRSAKRPSKPIETAREPATAAASWTGSWWAAPALLLLLVSIFYAVPLFSSPASIQWDAVDVHYSAQKYFSDNVLAGKLPHWTPYVYSGAPFLADPQTGAWYPLNWPFFLAGITPRAIEWELALHALLACLGAFLLVRDLLDDRPAAIFAGVIYGFSGFFAGHSSHTGMFQTAAIFPWLLWLFRRAVIVDWRTYGGVAMLVGGCLVLIGHFQSALYSLTALALFVAVMMILDEAGWRKRGLWLLAATLAGACIISAIQVLPGLELAANSVRARADFGNQTNASLTLGSLVTLLAPDFYGAVSGTYKGPGDITQFFFYQGLIVPVLAAAGLMRGKLRWIALALLAPSLWYALGPGGGLYLLIAHIPGFRAVRAPVHAWFVAALGLSILAASGAMFAAGRWKKPWLIPALIAIAFADLWYWNSSRNSLAYARASYDELYGARAETFSRATSAIRENALHRIWFERDSNTFGPMNGSLNTRTEVSYGYNPLELSRYADYCAAAAANPRLLEGLAITHRIEAAAGSIAPLASTLPRVSVPPILIPVASAGEARSALTQLSPAERAVVEAQPIALQQDVSARASISAYQGDLYRIQYTAASPTLLRVAIPYFPGWTATVASKPVRIVPVDLALTGVVVPAGTNEVLLSYRSTWFVAGAAISALGVVVSMAMLGWGVSRRAKAHT